MVRRMMRLSVLCIGFFALAHVGAYAAQQKNSLAPSGQQWADIVDKVRGAIVTIETQNGFGTGFLIAKDGTLVTNYHVIMDARQISVTLQSGEVYKAAYLIRTDEEKDIAILRLEAADLPFVDLGNSDSARVGEDVMAVGTPEGLEQTVSTGVLSGRRLMPEGYALLQTTAPVSHGSSGGPLLNRDGKTIGIITAFLTEGQNLNFAVPINYVRGIVDSLALSSTPPRLISANAATIVSAKSGATQPIQPKPMPPPESVPTPVDPHLLIPPVPAPNSLPSAPTSKRDATPVSSARTTRPDALPTSTPATIWIYRTKSFNQSLLNPTIYSRGRPLAKLGKGQYFALSVPAGTYYFSLTDKAKPGSEAWASVTPGQRVFFRVVLGKFPTGLTTIQPVSSDEAMKDFKSLKPITPDNIRSSDVLTNGPLN